MRAIIQRVTQASVSVDGEVISSIGKGLCVLLGISKHDTFKEIEYIWPIKVQERMRGKIVKFDVCSMTAVVSSALLLLAIFIGQFKEKPTEGCQEMSKSCQKLIKNIIKWVRKILNLRVFDDNGQRWKKSVVDKNLEVLCVSQFTLQAVLKGNKPDYHLAMGGEQSEAFYQDFLQHMRKVYSADAIKDGKFGAYMQVHIQNDGPVTISLETPPPKPAQQKQGKGTSGRDAVTKKEDEGASNSSVDHEKNDSSIDAEQQSNNFDELSLDEKQGNS